MVHDKALIISRSHSDLENPIYSAYIRGIKSQCKVTKFVDYFDQIADLGVNGFEKEVTDILEKENINLIFFIFVSGDPTINPYFIQKISKNRFIAMVFWDTEQFFEQIDRYYAQLADLVILTANYEYIYKLNTLGVNAICPFSLFDSTKYKLNTKKQQNSIDVSFVGEVTKGKRQEYIQYLLDNNIKVESYGVGTKNGKVSFEKVVDIFNNSKINLSFTGTYDNSVYSFCSNINNRIQQNKGKPIEISLCGGFVLTEHVPGIEKVFPDNSIDSFISKEEMLKKINFYLANDELRNTMQQRAHEYSIKNYDSIVAFKKIFSTINTITPKKEKNLILDNIFIKVHNTFHLFYAITFLLNSKSRFAFEEIKYIFNNGGFLFKDIKNFIVHLIKSYLKKLVFKKSCNKLFKSIRGKDIVIYGAGIHTDNLFKMFPKLLNLNIKAIADKNKNLWGEYKNNILIISPDEIAKFADVVIISSAKFEKEIKSDLIKAHRNKLTIHTLYDKFNIDLVSKRKDAYQIYRDTLKLK